MSVRLRNIKKVTLVDGVRRVLFDGMDFYASQGARIGVLGGPKSGKSTLLRLISGTETFDQGAAERESQVSWPIPQNAIFLLSSSIAANIRFVGRLYGVRDEYLPRRIGEMVEICEFLNVPMQRCPQPVKQRLSLGLGIAMDFDIYLFDGSLSPVDKDFKEQARGRVLQRMENRGFVLASANPAEVEQNCESVYVLDAGRAKYFAQAKEGVEYFKELLKSESKKQEEPGAEAKRAEEEETAELSDVELLGAAIESAIE